MECDPLCSVRGSMLFPIVFFFNSPQQLVLHLAHLAEGCVPGGIALVSSLSTATLSFGNGAEMGKEGILLDEC